MTYYDPGAALRQKDRADKFRELKKYISSNEKGKVNKWILAYEHIVNLEIQLEKQEKQIDEYQNFFSLLQNLLTLT